jgi:hypothetical protein
MDKIFAYYEKILNYVPIEYRIPLVALIIIFMIIVLVKFLRKHLFWIVVFVLLAPFVYPSLKQVSLYLWGALRG